MSLQVWLPLNGTLDNQGLCDITFENINGEFNSYGKIGQCYYTKNGVGYLSAVNLSDFKEKFSKEMSLSCWVKINTFNTTWAALISGCTTTQAWAGNSFSLIRNYNSNALCFNISDGTNYTSTNCSTSVLNTNQWYHITCTYDGSYCKLYVDGLLQNSFATTLVPNFSNITTITVGAEGYNTQSVAYKGDYYINDVRIYNHALSLKEIKEISKGLVLHYRLAGLGQENLITGNFSCTSTNTTYERQGTVGCVITAADLMANQGKTLTLSYDVYSLGDYTQNTAGTWQADRFGIHGSVKYTRTGASTSTQDYPLAGLLPIGKNGRVFTSWTIPTGITSFDTNLTFAIQTDGRAGYAYPASNNSSTWYLKNVKLEWGSVATPWVPNSADALYTAMGYNNNIEYDCSGFNNNATTSGKIEVSCDHYKYNNSYYFSDKSSYIKLPQHNYSGMSNSYTFSWWGKISSIASKMAWGFSDGNRLNVYPSTYFCWNTGDGGSNPFKNDTGTGVSYNSYSGDWHHFVVTGDGVNTKLYLDGTYAGKSTTYKPLTGTQIYISGWDTSGSYKWVGNLSDFRIYSTALSADDVKELYEAGAHIDNHGNVYGYELKEE